MPADSIPLVSEIIIRDGWRRTEGFTGFPVPIQPHFADEFPGLSPIEFDLLIGFQLWWINAPATARAEMAARQQLLGPAAWTAFIEPEIEPVSSIDPEFIARKIRQSLKLARVKSPMLSIPAICCEPTAKVLETASTISDIQADIDASIPQQIQEQNQLLSFIVADRLANPMAPADYRKADFERIQRKIVKLTSRLNGNAGENWVAPFDQRFAKPEHFK